MRTGKKTGEIRRQKSSDENERQIDRQTKIDTEEKRSQDKKEKSREEKSRQEIHV